MLKILLICLILSLCSSYKVFLMGGGVDDD
jgi:hypothetical protein